ncbi:MAG: hypothetical protein JSV32_05000 [Dehalococcoidia bacterium]|jgi:hypothetical protein|nr:MAG: hypothetical protein JSV32_05000 [Dehalococcoidia bacterium]
MTDNDELFMTTEDAFEIVYDLAEQNVLEEKHCDEEAQLKEREKQMLALDVVHDFLVNNVFD